MTARDIVLHAIESINAGNVQETLSFYADSVRQLSPSPDGCGLRERTGKAALREVLVADVEQRGTKFVPQRVICEGNVVAVQSLNSGLLGGHHVEQPVAAFFEVQGNLIVAVTVYYDCLGLRKALGQG